MRQLCDLDSAQNLPQSPGSAESSVEGYGFCCSCLWRVFSFVASSSSACMFERRFPPYLSDTCSDVYSQFAQPQSSTTYPSCSSLDGPGYDQVECVFANVQNQADRIVFHLWLFVFFISDTNSWTLWLDGFDVGCSKTAVCQYQTLESIFTVRP